MSASLKKSYKSYQNPDVRNYLVVEVRDSDNPQWQIPPAFGTKHPDTKLFPGHKLVAIRNEPSSKMQLWMYAADPAGQDAYNAKISYPYKGNPSFPRYTRTYLIRRGEHTPLAAGSLDPIDPAAVLVAQESKPADEPYGSLYDLVVRVYDRIPGSAAGASPADTNATGIGQTDGGYQVLRPLGALRPIRLVWKLTLPRTIAENQTATGRLDYTVCPIPGYSFLKLVAEKVIASDDENQTATVERQYAEDQNSGTPLLTMRRSADLEPPERFMDYRQERRETLGVIADEGTQTPDGWDGTPASTVTRESRVEMQTLTEGEKQKLIVTYEYGPLTRRMWDDNLQQHVTTSFHAVPAADIDDWLADSGNIDPDTDFYETEDVSRHWVIVTRVRMPVGSSALPTLTYMTTKVHSWPRVYVDGEFKAVATKQGYSVYTAEIQYKQPWAGECRAKVERWWMKTPPSTAPGSADLTQIDYLMPTGLVLDWPIAQIEILECLHPPLTFTGTTGTTHPVYELEPFAKSLPGTKMWKGGTDTPVNAYDWPDSMVVGFDVTPYRGGYLYTRLTVYKPEFYLVA